MDKTQPRMFEDYIPKEFCKEFIPIKKSSLQLAMIMATAKGIKPCMDDWIAVDRYNAYRKICMRYNLFVRPDAVFKRAKEIPKSIVGSKHLTTTKMFGLPFNNSVKDGFVHVFISRSKKRLEDCFKNGWYPLVIKDRVINKPSVDSFKFGHDLGYPKCCTDFYQKRNNWDKYSYLYEAFKNTPKGQYHYLCNPFTKNVTYSYIYHMPCSYNCKSTIKLAQKIREAIYREEPGFAKEIDQRLKLPLLVFYEEKIYAFVGEIKNNILCYRDVYYIGQTTGDNLYEPDLRKGNSLFLEGKDVIILKNGRLVKRIKWQKNAFAPETPFIIQFN